MRDAVPHKGNNNNNNSSSNNNNNNNNNITTLKSKPSLEIYRPPGSYFILLIFYYKIFKFYNPFLRFSNKFNEYLRVDIIFQEEERKELRRILLIHG